VSYGGGSDKRSGSMSISGRSISGVSIGGGGVSGVSISGRGISTCVVTGISGSIGKTSGSVRQTSGNNGGSSGLNNGRSGGNSGYWSSMMSVSDGSSVLGVCDRSSMGISGCGVAGVASVGGTVVQTISVSVGRISLGGGGSNSTSKDNLKFRK